MINEIENYIKENSKKTAGQCLYVRQCYKRHLDDIKKKDFAYKFDVDQGMRVITFIESLHHTKGKKARQKLTLELWQKALLYILFGWRSSSGHRRYKRVYIEIPRKNGKTLLAVGIMLYVWLCEGEEGSEAYCIATKKDQANLAFEYAKQQVPLNPVLKKVLKCWQYSITRPDKNSTLKAISSDSKTADGVNPHFVLCDEYHAHDNDKLLSVMESGMGARVCPMTCIITTAGKSLTSPCYKEREYITQVLSGAIENDTHFAIIYTLDKGDDWTDSKVWHKANPNYLISIEKNGLADPVKKAIQKPTEQIEVKTKNFNLWQQSDVIDWIKIEVWDALKREIKIEDMQGRDAVCAVDMSSVRDFTSICYCVMPRDDSEKFILLWRLFMPCKDVNARSRNDNIEWQQWADMSYLTIDESGVIDYRDIKDQILNDAKTLQIKEICYDPHFATPLANELDNSGFVTVPISQSINSMCQFVEAFEVGVHSADIIHEINPVINFMLMCSRVKIKDERKQIVKPQRDKDRARIDGIITAIMAYGRAKLGYQQTNNGDIIEGFIAV